MICSQCQNENIPTARFCSECGAKLRAACPQCGTEVPPTAKFCHECAAPLTAPPSSPPAARVPGPASPSPVPQPPTLEAQFTSFQQGLPSSFREQLLARPEGENRLVTVLFADMSHSVQTTAHLPPDEAAALVSDLLKRMVDVLLKYEGRVDRFLGDGLLAVFGTPRAHESDPERAILAALDIRGAARELGMEVTAGINTGEVYVGGIGSERHQEVTVMGPVVNLASRLQGQAEPGQILAGEATYRHTRRAFAFAPRSVEVKGFSQPVTAYVVERALARPEKARGIEGLRAALIGRDEEFTKLTDALAEVGGGRGQMVSIIGEAGVGKSRLVAELKQRAVGHRLSAVGRKGVGCQPSAVGEDSLPITDSRQPTADGLLWLEGRCLELGMSAGYWLFVDLFRDYFGFAPEEEERARGERMVADLKRLVERGDLTEERMDEIGPLLGNMLSLRFGTAWDERLKNASPEQIKHQTFMAIRDLLLALARRQPVILVCEDLHWADSLSLDVISLLMEMLTLAPILLLCIYRPEREHKCWHLATIASRKCADRYTEIALRELTSPQSRRLVEALLTIENLPEAVKALILEKSRGNPFFVEEVVRSLIASGMVYHDGEAWRAKVGIESVSVPESVQSVILSRVDRLERELRDVLESASVIGRLFRRRLLQRTMAQAGELEGALAELEDQQLIYQERVVPEEEYSFQHVLTQETIYQGILRRRRTGFHQKVAEAIEALYQEELEEYYEQLAYHYERSEADEKAVEYLLKAGEKARRAYLNEEAICCFQRSLERLDRSGLGAPEGRLKALTGLGQIHQGIGKVAEAEKYFREALALGKETKLAPRELARLYFWLGEALHWLDRPAERLQLGEEGLALFGEAAESFETALMNSLIAMGHTRQGHAEQGREFTRRNAGFLQRLPYSEELRPAYIHIIDVYLFIDRNFREARNWLDALRRNAEQHHDLSALGEHHHRAAVALFWEDDLPGAMREWRQAVEVAERVGDIKLQGWALGGLATVALTRGDLASAEEYAGRRHQLAALVGFKGDLANFGVMMGTLAMCRHRWEAAETALREARRLAAELDNHGLESHCIYALGRLFLAQGNRPEAARRIRESLALLPQDHPMFPLALTVSLAGLEEAMDDPGAFREFCDQLRQERPEISPSLLPRWFLEPAQPDFGFRILDFGLPSSEREIQNPNATPGHTQRVPGTRYPAPEIQNGGWCWQDPLGDCSFAVGRHLEIRAANGRGLSSQSRSAPRLLRSCSGDFACQTLSVPSDPASLGTREQPAIGGLLLWKDTENYVWLARGMFGEHEISFAGCIANKELFFGRGRLPSGRTFLRLERRDGRVKALCSTDGQEWLTAGVVEFPVEDSVEVGVYAIGHINRLVYPGAYPEGTSIRFEAFEFWQ